VYSAVIVAVCALLKLVVNVAVPELSDTLPSDVEPL
jgi:hypothetical protein